MASEAEPDAPSANGKPATDEAEANKPQAEERSAQPLRDEIVHKRVQKERDAFIALIQEDEVRKLASSHHPGKKPCRIFKPYVRGSYNVCYFVQFGGSEGEEGGRDGEDNKGGEDVRWVVRVPLEPCLAFGGKSKLESEIATMQLVAEKTTIPAPKVVAYSLSDEREKPLSTYVILEYIEGHRLSYAEVTEMNLEQRQLLYSSLADIFIQLRRLEFPSIGCIVREESEDGSGHRYVVRKKNASLDINTHELEKLGSSAIQDKYYASSESSSSPTSNGNGVGRDNTLGEEENDGKAENTRNDYHLASSNAYMDMLLEIASNAFVKCRGNTSFDELAVGNALYHLDLFRQFARKWVDPLLDDGPFVLVHGDFEPFNLLVHPDTLEVVAVLDWEWSRVVPRQYFKAPLWLRYVPIPLLTYRSAYKLYLQYFDELEAIVRRKEQEQYGNELLADEWARAKLDGGFLVADALEGWTGMDWFAFRYINMAWFRGKEDLAARISNFMEADPSRKEFAARKMAETTAYEAELARLEHEI